jgi:hypothetical protein
MSCNACREDGNCVARLDSSMQPKKAQARSGPTTQISREMDYRTVFDNKILFMLEIPRVYLTGLGTHGCVEDPGVTRTGFRPDPYTGTVFAGPGMVCPKSVPVSILIRVVSKSFQQAGPRNSRQGPSGK